MDKKSTLESRFHGELRDLRDQIPAKYCDIIFPFLECYRRAARPSEAALPILLLFLQLLREQFRSPYSFQPYHQKVRHPIDYYRFGVDFIRLLVDLPHSRVLGLEHFDELERLVERGENGVLFANHQTETDPLAISILLEKSHPKLAESIIYVAGERVVTDPLAIPFSMGCDLLCIYSKRYIDHPPELKMEKQLHNKKTMELMSRLLREGGKVIYVAPSGGRDRRNSKGIVEMAPFDAPSIEMFYLMSRKAKTPTHFYPLALATYDLLPPPETIQRELGEKRSAHRTSIHLSLGPPFDMEHFPSSDHPDKEKRRFHRAHAIWSAVHSQYQFLMRTP